jgi:meso-butanediol dehydrogenase/(S,S)-butanediol dehydrogenase/diacetyl reductase
MEKHLSGKVAIVTGAGQGIGKGVALRLARDGAQIVIAEYEPETAEATSEEIHTLGGRALPYPIDLSQVEHIQPMVDQIQTPRPRMKSRR